jgi:hypothetical protein
MSRGLDQGRGCEAVTCGSAARGRPGRQARAGRGAGAIDDPDRLPLPPGHPRSWDLLTAGTLLAGAPYPYPVFV